jgi:hypothetical protein
VRFVVFFERRLKAEGIKIYPFRLFVSFKMRSGISQRLGEGTRRGLHKNPTLPKRDGVWKLIELGVEIALGAREDRSVVAAGDLDPFHEVRNLDSFFKNEAVA